MSSTPPTTTTAAAATNSRFTPNTETLEDALKTQTVGLVHLSDFKKRRVELAEQREREAAEKLQAYRGTSSREGSETPNAAPAAARKKKRKTVVKGKLSFGGEEEDEEGGSDQQQQEAEKDNGKSEGEGGAETAVAGEVKKRKVNPKLRAPPPKVLTKNTLLREAQERETLRREFLALQEKIKNEEISIPFVFYDGASFNAIPIPSHSHTIPPYPIPKTSQMLPGMGN